MRSSCSGLWVLQGANASSSVRKNGTSMSPGRGAALVKPMTPASMASFSSLWLKIWASEWEPAVPWSIHMNSYCASTRPSKLL